MAASEYRTFEEFWPFYVHEHTNPTNRALHVVGTTLATSLAAAGLLMRRPAFLLAAPVVGYGFAWFGHFFVEGNKPATFKYPLWSLAADYVMWWKTMNGTMAAEVERVMSANGVHDGANGVHDDAHVQATPAPQEVN